VLVGANCPIVTGIRGNMRHRFARISGQTTHASGVPRSARHDAARAGAALVAALDRFWQTVENDGGDMVLTFGEFSTDPAQHGITKVPGGVDFTLDMRSQDSATLDAFEAQLALDAARIAAAHGVRIDLGPATRAAPAPMTETIRESLQNVARSEGFPYRDIPAWRGCRDDFHPQRTRQPQPRRTYGDGGFRPSRRPSDSLDPGRAFLRLT